MEICEREIGGVVGSPAHAVRVSVDRKYAAWAFSAIICMSAESTVRSYRYSKRPWDV